MLYTTVVHSDMHTRVSSYSLVLAFFYVSFSLRLCVLYFL